MSDDSLDTRISIAETKINHLEQADDRHERNIDSIRVIAEATRREAHEVAATVARIDGKFDNLSEQMRDKNRHLESQIATNANQIKQHVVSETAPIVEKTDRTDRKVTWMIVVLAFIEVVGPRFPWDKLPFLS